MKAWLFDRDEDLGRVTRRAIDGLADAAFEIEVTASSGDWITVRVVAGTWTCAPDLLVYVESRGAFEVVRREVWPPVSPDDRPRVLLALRAWPNRE
jgi:hypothetical protein